MKIAVCDDEIEIAEKLVSILKEMMYEVDCFISGKEVIKQKADVYILDTGMEEMDGIAVGLELRKKYPKCSIIYLTNFDDYRAQAFRVHAFDYLAKPVNKKELERVLKEVELLHSEEEKLFFFKTKDGFLQMKKEDILYFEFTQRKVLMHTKQKNYLLLQSLHSIYDVLQPYGFAMVHKAFCINLDHVQLVKGSDITMSNQDIVPLSQKRGAKFRQELNDWLFTKVVHP